MKRQAKTPAEMTTVETIPTKMIACAINQFP
jgi:hypothetical protein